MQIKNRILNMPIRAKFVCIFIFLMAVVICANMFLFTKVNTMIKQMDQVYISNSEMADMLECLDTLQDNITLYLDTKSTEAMKNYYGAVSEYRTYLEKFNNKISSNEVKLKQKNIRCMSETYLLVAERTIEAKRGRNVEKYKEGYEEGKRLYRYIRNAVFSLNDEQFKNNSDTYQVLSESLGYMELISEVIIGAIAFVNIVFILLITRRITRPLTKLVNAANQVGVGNFDIDSLDVHGRDEIGVVSLAFNKMVSSIQDYVETIKENMEKERIHAQKELLMETHLKDAELKYLQAQINPHFLFNTLNAGAQLAMMEDAERTYEYLQRVAELLRYNIKKDHEVVTLREEVALIDVYIYILNVRFSGDIHYKKEIDEAVLDTRMPSMILQPIVENSVNYGIRGIAWEGVIGLSAEKKGDEVLVRIEDNGVGIEPDKIEQILSGTLEKKGEGGSNGIGLDNVIGRLKLFYEKEHVMEITSPGKDKGTKTVLFLNQAADEGHAGTKEKREDRYV